MTPTAPLRWAIVMAAVAAAGSAGALPGGAAPPSSGLRPDPVVLFGHDSRRTVKDFAFQHHVDPAVLAHRYAASGLIRCGAAHGAGQLTVASDVVTTAAHVFFDESGKLRAKACVFSTVVDGRDIAVTIDISSIIAGSRDPYAVEAVHDWAVARLSAPVRDITPYELGPDATPGTAIVFAARGHWDWGHGYDLSLQSCAIHDRLNIGQEGTREYAFDCDTGDGASGGALLSGATHDALSAILVGYRSVDPETQRAFSALHYNFSVTVEGAFRNAVLAAAHPMIVTR